MVRKETTVTGNKVTVSSGSFESASPVLGWWGLFFAIWDDYSIWNCENEKAEKKVRS